MAPPILLIDNDCRLCRATASFARRHARDSAMRILPLDSEPALRLLQRAGWSEAPGGTAVLLEEDRLSVRSDAVLRLCRYLRRPWRWAAWAMIVPRPVRDAVYRWVSRNRHRFCRTEGACDVERN